MLSAEADLKTTEKQAETLRSELHLCEINLEIERQVVKELTQSFVRPGKLHNF